MVDNLLEPEFGPYLTILGGALMLVTSVIEESLREFHRSDFFDGMDEARAESFERLLKMEEDYLIVARMVRLAAYLFAFIGFILLFDGTQSSPMVAAAGGVVGMALIFSVILPTVLAANWAEQTLRAALKPFHCMVLPLLPFVHMSNWVGRGVAKVRGEDAEETPEQEFEDDIADHLDEAQRDGVIGEGERQMITSIIDFGDATVRDVMTPRTEMVCVSTAESVDKAIALANAEGHSRLPVYEGGRDNIVGVFYVRDALRYWSLRKNEVLSIKEIMRKPRFVPESQELIALLAEIRANKTHQVIVLDESGGTAGLVTLEDLLEEIVGDIQDEFDLNEESEDSALSQFQESGAVRVDARMRVSDANDRYRLSLPESADYTSIGGLLSSHLGRIPAPGEEVELAGASIRVLESTERQVRQVQLEPLADDEKGTESGRYAAS